MGTGKAPPLPGRGKGAGKAAAKKSNGKAKVGLRYCLHRTEPREPWIGRYVRKYKDGWIFHMNIQTVLTFPD